MNKQISAGDGQKYMSARRSKHFLLMCMKLQYVYRCLLQFNIMYRSQSAKLLSLKIICKSIRTNCFSTFCLGFLDQYTVRIETLDRP